MKNPSTIQPGNPNGGDRSVLIVAAKRSAIGRFGGVLKSLAATEIAEQTARGTLDAAMLEQCGWVTAGQVLQAGCGMNPARQVALGLGIPEPVPACTVNMVCGSGLQAVAGIADAIACGGISCGLALGMESMSRAPFYAPGVRWGTRFGDAVLVDALPRDGLTDPVREIGMGETAERIAEHFGIPRDDQDRFALRSQRRFAAAKDSFAAEIVPVRTGEGWVADDEHPRGDTTLDKLAGLKAVFRADGTVTAGNASGMNDGAAVVFLASSEAAARNGWQPLARIVGWAARGCDPVMMGMGPVGAVRMLCGRIGWEADAVDCVEINEAFAVQTLACIRELALDPEAVNPRGGAIALGHPIGCSGARVLVTLLHHLRNGGGSRGIATLCIGGGMGIAMAVEVVDR